jgi:hypothetical protein
MPLNQEEKEKEEEEEEEEEYDVPLTQPCDNTFEGDDKEEEYDNIPVPQTPLYVQDDEVDPQLITGEGEDKDEDEGVKRVKYCHNGEE